MAFCVGLRRGSVIVVGSGQLFAVSHRSEALDQNKSDEKGRHLSNYLGNVRSSREHHDLPTFGWNLNGLLLSINEATYRSWAKTSRSWTCKHGSEAVVHW